ncbi:MAG TPA: hypothetical protein DEP47_07030, partial [Chloroflexi bacterium]|nr:hypothetical protein [Chloroflexota bacterium]
MPNPEVPPVKPLQPHKTALIVGGSSGIGAALVQTLVENSYCVAVVARREAILSKLCEEVNQSA